jgi:transcriptional regulator with XRE-family HTH domain
MGDTRDDSREPGSLARRLEQLFQTAHPPGRGPYSTAEAVAGINQTAGERVMSYNYLYQLRRGTKDQPGAARLKAIASFFRVPVSYFYDDDPDDARAREELELAAALRDQGIRHIAFRAAGLSPESLRAILAQIENTRRLEGLPSLDDEPDSPPG